MGIDYQGRSKILEALSQQSGGGGTSSESLPRSSADVEVWESGALKCYKMMLGMVTVAVKSANTPTSQTTVGTIPEKFRPPHDVYVTGEDYDGGGRGIGIKTNGQVIAYAGGTGMYVTATYIKPIDWEYKIVPWYKSATESAVRKINGLGSDYDSFIIITDTHGVYNKQHSQNIVRYIVERTGINCFWLGDVSGHLWADNDQSYAGEDYQVYADPLRACSNKVYFALGNHERVSWGGLDYNDVVACNNDFIASKDVTGNKDKYYYYFDNADKKIRYLIINTSESTTDWHRMTSTQLAWIRDAVTLPNASWNLVVLGHLDIDPDCFLYDGSDDADEIINAIKSCNGHIVGYFCGHQHLDYISVVKNSFRQVALLCDKFDNHIYYPEYQIPQRVENTESEQAVTIVHVNTKTKSVSFTRIGAFVTGQLHSYSYD